MMGEEGEAERAAPAYGIGDASFRAAGGEEGIRRLVDRFYDLMNERSDAKRIRAMHPDDLAISRDKLSRFLCGWLGGPKRYSEKYGPIRIPRAHAHLDIGVEERDAWLSCMRAAVAEQPYTDDFKAYLLRELAVPAERIRITVEQRLAAARKMAGTANDGS
jgi:hemoglobin